MIAMHPLHNADIQTCAKSEAIFQAHQPILVVDDSGDDREFLSMCLSSYLPPNKPVITFGNGMELLRYLDTLAAQHIEADEFAEEMPDMIFLDLMMPGINGIETLEVIRRQPIWADTPITLITGSSNDLAIKKAQDAGANAFLPKPFTRFDVMSAMHRRNNFSPAL